MGAQGYSQHQANINYRTPEAYQHPQNLPTPEEWYFFSFPTLLHAARREQQQLEQAKVYEEYAKQQAAYTAQVTQF
jgi:hypothetical protein